MSFIRTFQHFPLYIVLTDHCIMFSDWRILDKPPNIVPGPQLELHTQDETQTQDETPTTLSSSSDDSIDSQTRDVQDLPRINIRKDSTNIFNYDFRTKKDLPNYYSNAANVDLEG